MKKILNINTILIGLVLVAGIFGIIYMNANKTEGDKAIVDIQFDGKKEQMFIDLSVDETYHIDADLPVTLVVKDGKISFQNSQCPDKVCEGFGEICYDNETASCLPAGVIVTIDEAVE